MIGMTIPYTTAVLPSTLCHNGLLEAETPPLNSTCAPFALVICARRAVVQDTRKKRRSGVHERFAHVSETAVGLSGDAEAAARTRGQIAGPRARLLRGEMSSLRRIPCSCSDEKLGGGGEGA